MIAWICFAITVQVSASNHQEEANHPQMNPKPFSPGIKKLTSDRSDSFNTTIYQMSKGKTELKSFLASGSWGREGFSDSIDFAGAEIHQADFKAPLVLPAMTEHSPPRLDQAADRRHWPGGRRSVGAGCQPETVLFNKVSPKARTGLQRLRGDRSPPASILAWRATLRRSRVPARGSAPQ
jgi:hypothetical protein